MALFCGIDPGLRGGIVILDDNLSIVSSQPMPASNKKLDAKAISDLLIAISETGATFCLERVSAFQGASSASSFSFGYGYGLLCGILYGTKARTVYIPPNEWTKWAHMGTYGDIPTKLRSRQAAERIWPHLPWEHDGVTDAALIAAFGSRWLNGTHKEPPESDSEGPKGG